MSHYMTALAMKQTGLKPATKIVLYWLCDHHNSETDDCFPSLRLLQSECEMDKSTIIRHLKTLENLGLIKRKIRKRSNGSNTSTEYILSTKQLVAKCNNPSSKIQQPLLQNATPLTLEYNLGIEPYNKNHIKKIKNTGSKSEKNLEIDKGAEKKRKPTEFPSKLINHNRLSFEDFWKVYPKRNGVKLNKAKAEIQYKKAIKQIDPEKLIERARIYRRASNGFPVDAFRWLRDSCWKDFEEQRVQTDNQRRYKKIIAGYSQ